MNIEQATRFAKERMSLWGLEGWTFKINSRLSRALGRCNYSKKVIELQKRYIEENDEKLVYDTVLHEIAHAKAGMVAGHGPVWKQWCLKVGARPQATKSIDEVKLTRRYRLALQEGDDVVLMNTTSDRKLCLKNKHLRGRPETSGKLFWIENKVG